MTKPSAAIAVFALCAGAALAQVGVPLFGYLPDGAHLRPVFGIPGAAMVASALDLGRDFGRIAVSPLQDYAIGTDASSGTVYVVPSVGSPTPLAGASANPDLIGISPGGSAAVLWFSSDNHAQIFSGLPNSPVMREVDASFVTTHLGDPALKESPAALAISDDGQWMAGAWARGAYAIGPNSEVRTLPLEEAPRAMSFFAGRQDLALATGLHILSIADVGGSAAVSTLADVRTNPLGIGISADNRRLVVADRSGLLYSLDLTAGAMAQFNCGCSPEGVFAMGRGGMFRLTGLANGSFRVLDTVKEEILFVPLMAGQGGQP